MLLKLTFKAVFYLYFERKDFPRRDGNAFRWALHCSVVQLISVKNIAYYDFLICHNIHVITCNSLILFYNYKY